MCLSGLCLLPSRNVTKGRRQCGDTVSFVLRSDSVPQNSGLIKSLEGRLHLREPPPLCQLHLTGILSILSFIFCKALASTLGSGGPLSPSQVIGDHPSNTVPAGPCSISFMPFVPFIFLCQMHLGTGFLDMNNFDGCFCLLGNVCRVSTWVRRGLGSLTSADMPMFL